MIGTRAGILLGVLALAATLMGCGAETADEPENNAGKTIRVKHSLSTTAVPPDPKRVVALGFVDEDALAALDITPVGYLGYERDGVFPWQQGEVDLTKSTDLDEGGSEEASLDFEKLARLDPDLILATGYWQIDDQYKRLSQIAPTIGPITTVGGDSWQETTRLIGTAVGQADEMERQIAEAERRVDDVAAALPGLEGKTFVNAYIWPDGGIVVGANPDESLAQTLSKLGLSVSPEVVAEINPTGKLTGGQPLAMERLDLLDADMLLMGSRSKALRADLENKNIYKSLAVVKDGRTIPLDRVASAATNNPTILNVPWFVETIRPGLERVAAAK